MPSRRLILSVLLLSLPVVSATGLELPPKPDPAPESRQFDFWLGTWDLTWEVAGETKHGTNTITRILEGHVVRESFEGMPGTELVGQSYSVYLPRCACWQQTWVDNYGGLLTFEGGMVGDEMILTRRIEHQGRIIMQRMIFTDIEDDSLTWRWQRSLDGGESWEDRWVIAYQRQGVDADTAEAAAGE